MFMHVISTIIHVNSPNMLCLLMFIVSANAEKYPSYVHFAGGDAPAQAALRTSQCRSWQYGCLKPATENDSPENDERKAYETWEIRDMINYSAHP